MERKQVMIGDRAVGGGAPAFLVFEGGATHTGLASALQLVDIAADAGVDAIKFQTVFADKMMSAPDVQFDYGTIDGGTARESLAAILKRREMPYPDWAKLKARADQRSLTFFSTPDTPETIDFLVGIGTPAIKIAGGDMNNYPLIRYAAATKLPVLLDTRGTLGELERAIETCVAAGNEQIVIVHCPSGYPSAVESIRLRMIEVYRRLFPFPVGFSDHSPGLEMNVAALALGADFIEKTITLDRAAHGPEHVMSLPPESTREFVVRLREVEQAMGSPYAIVIDAGAKQAMLKARRSIVLARAARAGETLTEDMITYKRPGYGMAPELTPLVVGRVLRRDVPANVPLPWEAL